MNACLGKEAAASDLVYVIRVDIPLDQEAATLADAVDRVNLVR
jgi:hypothetical protein